MRPGEDRAQVRWGYRRAREVTRRHARSFFFASALLFGARRRAAFALYAFCRRLDDLVDAPGQDPAALPARLAAARRRVAALYPDLPELAAPHLRGPARGPGGAEAQAPWDEGELAALADTVRRFRIPERHLQELLCGMEMDLTVARYATWEQLHLYCYRVAGVVGVMMAPVLGCEDPAALSAAEDLGVAMQLTNILRDVHEDLARGRVYLPAEELAAFGLSGEDLAQGRVGARWRAFMRFQVERARAFYARGAAGVRALRGFGCQRMVRLMGATYGDLLRVLEARDYDVFRGRAFVPTGRKLGLALATLVRPAHVLRAPAGPVPLPVLPVGGAGEGPRVVGGRR